MNPIERVCDIIQTGMDLDDDQIYIWNQRKDLPSDSRIYVVVGVVGTKVFGTSRSYNPSNPALAETVSVNTKATLSIDIQGNTLDALTRKEEIVAALFSTYSQQMQEKESFHIARIPSSFVNLSALEGTALLYRFNLTVNIQYTVSKTNDVEHFDTFADAQVTTEA